MFQQGDNLVAILELPGVNKEELDIQAKDNTIRISGKKRSPTRKAPACTGASGAPACSTAP